MRTLAERRISQSIALETGQVLKLREVAKQAEKSLSAIVREAVDEFLGRGAKNQ